MSHGDPPLEIAILEYDPTGIGVGQFLEARDMDLVD